MGEEVEILSGGPLQLPSHRVERMTVAALKGAKAPYNPRRMSPSQFEKLRASLARFGVVEPLVYNERTKTLVGGHQRVDALESLRVQDVDVVVVDLNENDEKVLNLALNRVSGEWDWESVATILRSLDDDGRKMTGFEDEEWESLVDGTHPELDEVENEVNDEGPGPPPERAVSRIGDLWELGDHRLFCGDSTKEEDVARVIGQEKAALCATDPPYLVDYTGERPDDSGKDWTGSYREIDIEDASSFFMSVFKNIIVAIAPKAAIYCWHAHKRAGEIQRVWQALDIVDHQQIIWVKPAKVFGFVYWPFRHEPCLMGWRKGSKPEHDGDQSVDSVWIVDFDGKSRSVGSGHPTSKPSELFALPMRKHTVRGDVVFEPFCGSGSQIIAAEQLGRRCKALEISPIFVDVAIERWQKATGKTAVLSGTSHTFAEVAAQRA